MGDGGTEYFPACKCRPVGREVAPINAEGGRSGVVFSPAILGHNPSFPFKIEEGKFSIGKDSTVFY